MISMRQDAGIMKDTLGIEVNKITIADLKRI